MLSNEYWLGSTVSGKFPLEGVLLRVKSSCPEEQPTVTRYMMASTPAGKLPFGIDHPDDLETAKLDCKERFGVEEGDWKVLTSPPEFTGVFDAAIDDAIRRASEAQEQ